MAGSRGRDLPAAGSDPSEAFPRTRRYDHARRDQSAEQPGRACAQTTTAGYRAPHVEHVTRDFALELDALAEPDTLFGMSPDWTSLSDAEKAAVVREVRTMAGDRTILPVPSTALIAVARR